ncbi:MAG TPA: CBS domain-containing protein [Methylomirabilota bacterium]
MSLASRLATAFLATHPLDAAPVVERLPPAEAVQALAAAPASVAAGVLRHMAPPAAAECLERLGPAGAAPIVAALPLDGAALLLRRLPEPTLGATLAGMPAEAAAALATVLRHPPYTAGALMDPRVLAASGDMTVGEAFARIRQSPRHVLYYLYVVDRTGRLVGVLNLRELMLAPVDATLGAVMRPATARLTALDGMGVVVVHPGWRALHALPVVDAGGRFVGAIRYETIRRLEAHPERVAPVGSRVGLWLGLAELCWIGLTGVLVSLGSPPSGSSGEAPAGGRPS